jgi:hypothetical protein
MFPFFRQRMARRRRMRLMEHLLEQRMRRFFRRRMLRRRLN